MAIQLTGGFPTTLLVVDDEAPVLQVFETLLAPQSIPVRTAPTGEQAIELLRKEPFAALLVDKNLPGVDGIQVMRVAREEQPQCACIVMTAYASVDSAVEALRLGARDYLEKPFADLELVVQKVQNAIEHQRLEYENRELLGKLRQFEAELKTKDAEVAKKTSEVELFNRLLEQRVRQETDDLRQKTAMLESALTSNRGLDHALAMHSESLLEHVRGVQLDDKVPMAVARGVVAHIVRQLEANLSMIRSAINARKDKKP